MPLGAPEGGRGGVGVDEVDPFTFNFRFKKKKKNSFFVGSYFFLGAISLRWVVLPSPKIVISLPSTYEKLPCKVPAVREILRNIQTDIQRSCYFTIRIIYN